MSAKSYNKMFPRYVRYKQDRPMLPMGVIPPCTQVPLYNLGWMIKVKHIGQYCGGYGDVMKYLVRPNWRKHECEPANQSDLERQGLMTPNVYVFGRDHVFIQIARNQHQSMDYLHTADGLKKVVDQAFVALGLKPDAFDPLSNLLWVRWPGGERFPELKFPCIGEHYWPDEVSGETSKEAASEEKLPQVAPEIVYIITRKFYENAEAYR